jgi:hypothetical protein
MGRGACIASKEAWMRYGSILEGSLPGTFCRYSLEPSEIVSQQDGDSKHPSRLASNWFHDHGIRIWRLPPSLPDMNIIEHAWDQLDANCVLARSCRPVAMNCGDFAGGIGQIWIWVSLTGHITRFLVACRPYILPRDITPSPNFLKIYL